MLTAISVVITGADGAAFTESYRGLCVGNGACVECALLPDGGMAGRDTQDRDGVVLDISADAWQKFATELKK